MKLSQKTEYALHSLLYLAYRSPDVILVDEIADDQNISKSYLAKVMQKLSKAGLVKSYVGAGGGYDLAKDPAEITFADVMRIFEAEEYVLDCLAEQRGCKAKPNCKMIDVIDDAYQAMLEQLEDTTIQNIINSFEE